MKNKLRLRISIWRNVGLNKILLNFVFQRIFRVNSQISYLVNYQSTYIGNDIQYHFDFKTMTSFSLSPHCYFQSINGIRLGENFLFAPGVKLISANHSQDITRKSEKSPPIIIGDNVWLGADVIILPGVKLGNNIVVGAGSVVTKSFPEDDIVIAGNPAKIIRAHHV
jgi:acetyltransferase-like isoleucine patch superfamily enzyme